MGLQPPIRLAAAAERVLLLGVHGGEAAAAVLHWVRGDGVRVVVAAIGDDGGGGGRALGDHSHGTSERTLEFGNPFPLSK